MMIFLNSLKVFILKIDNINQEKYNFLFKLYDRAEIINIKEV